jgi:hypothetical protein
MGVVAATLHGMGVERLVVNGVSAAALAGGDKCLKRSMAYGR